MEYAVAKFCDVSKFLKVSPVQRNKSRTEDKKPNMFDATIDYCAKIWIDQMTMAFSTLTANLSVPYDFSKWFKL